MTLFRMTLYGRGSLTGPGRPWLLLRLIMMIRRLRAQAPYAQQDEAAAVTGRADVHAVCSEARH